MAKDHLKKLENKLGLKATYYFTITRVKTFLDQGEMEPIVTEMDRVLYTADSLVQLAKEVKVWIKCKKAGYVEGDFDVETLFMKFDTHDLTIDATIHALDQDNQTVPLAEPEYEEFLQIIDKKRHAKKQS